jgi:tRNA U34 5-methylaminomethyl-2-thiouridine-forming methyltransferase MnmC
MSDLKLITTEDGSHSLFNPDLNETYHSIHGAIQESKHVFIDAGLDHWIKNNKKPNLRILEIGFGTGLNAFLTCLHSPPWDVNVYYKSWEAFPIDPELSNQLNYSDTLGSKHLFEKLYAATWEQAVVISASFTLHKHKGNVISDMFNESSCFDLIYYDAFGPSKQPEMWTKDILSKVVDVLDGNGVFVTYSAKGQVKRDLKSLGLVVETLAGPPGKLQMVRATRSLL